MRLRLRRLPGFCAEPGRGWVCLRGRTGCGATSSRQVMAVLSSQERGDAEMLPPLFSAGTAGYKNSWTLFWRWRHLSSRLGGLINERSVCSVRSSPRNCTPGPGDSPESPAVDENSRAGVPSFSSPPLPWCLYLCFLLDFSEDTRTPAPFPSSASPLRFRGSVMSRGTRISTGSLLRDGRGEHFGVTRLVALRRRRSLVTC